jgi:hypothetical protein
MTTTSDEQEFEAEGRRRRRRRYLTGFGFFLIALILLILIVLIAAKGCDNGEPTPPPVTVEVTRIVEVTVVHTVEVPGPTQLVTQLVTTTPCTPCYPGPEPPPTGLPLARSFQILLIVFAGLALLFIAYRLRGTATE